jgi:tRNA(adenine34) deaminase
MQRHGHDDLRFMQEALTEARRAFELGEVPLGCVIVHEGQIIGRGANERATRKNVLCHAEITAISQACEEIGDWRLENCRLYVTLEPCPMCAGAIVQARIPTVIYGAKSPKSGCAGSVLDILNEPRFNHRCEVISGICEEECGALMSEFMRTLRTAEHV